jgi:hypothetical protein
VLVFLQNEDESEAIVHAIETPEKYDKQIQENAKTLVNMLGPYSNNKAAILHILCDKLPIKYAA